MADRAKKISELPAATSLANTDLIVVVANTAGTATTKKITRSNLFTGAVSGPYANDSAANSAGVSVGALYYSADGVVHIRLT